MDAGKDRGPYGEENYDVGPDIVMLDGTTPPGEHVAPSFVIGADRGCCCSDTLRGRDRLAGR